MNKWKLNVYIKDSRVKRGERVMNEFILENISEDGMKSVVQNMEKVFPAPKHRIEFHPATKIVKNLMSGKDVEIDYDTPHFCDPSTEAYWSM